VAETEKENRKKDKVRNKNEKKNFTIPRSDYSLSLSIPELETDARNIT